jgi:predicted transposase/invertase (TIGR01784 family)
MDHPLTPHDEFFSFVLSDTENARDFILNTLPDPVVELLDLESISVSRESFIDDKLKEGRTDVLIRTRVCGCPAYVYVLVEHKSNSERWTVFQLLKYMVRIWDKEVKSCSGKAVKKPLPVIIPVIFYQGSRTWRYPPSFGEYFEAPADFKHYIPDFTPEFTDLARTPDKRLFSVYTKSGQYGFDLREGNLYDLSSDR